MAIPAYCGISNICIDKENKEVYILPLIDRTKLSVYDGRPHYAAMLPILGTYNEYCGMENIIKDDNTELIEKYFNMSIEDFIKNLTDNNRLGFKVTDNEKINELGEYDFMWILKSVYDNLSVDYVKEYAPYNYIPNDISNWRNKEHEVRLNDFFIFFGNGRSLGHMVYGEMAKMVYGDKDPREIYDMYVGKKLANKYRIYNEYLSVENFERFADRIVQIYYVEINISYISKWFTPFVLYRTSTADKEFQLKLFEIFTKALDK